MAEAGAPEGSAETQKGSAETPLRLSLVLARAGVASRRGADALIAAGRVRVNGAVVREAARRTDAARETVTVDGAPIGAAEPLRYFLLHKPVGVLSTARDDRGRPTVVDALPPDAGRCVPMGRLDFASEGLVLLSNDGPLMDGLLHPRRGLAREYLVEVRGRPDGRTLEQIRSGVLLEDGAARAKVRPAKRPGRPPRPARPTPGAHSAPGDPGTTWLVLTLAEGRKREVRRLCEAVGHPVARLIRVRLGPLRLGDLPLGAIRPLTPLEIQALHEAAALPADPSAPTEPSDAAEPDDAEGTDP